jgi:NADH-quinone oxidoreductase E subunit
MSGQTNTTVQPDDFAFTAENAEAAQGEIAKYPEGWQESAVMPLLDLAQRQHDGWLPRAAMDTVAGMLGMAPIRVYEVATFYTMYNLEPVGKNHVQVCTNLPCWLRGSDAIVGACKKNLGLEMGETSEDGQFTLSSAECLGACANAPMMQVGDDYYEDLDTESTQTILEALKAGQTPKPGSQSGRHTSEPAGGPTTLKDLKNGAGK